VNRPVDIGPNILVTLWWLFVAVVIIQIIVEVTL
jgi:hypothetical protein